MTVAPALVIAARPLLGTLTAVTLRASPSASVSLSNTLMTMALSSSVVVESPIATGGSLTEVTMTVTVPV